MKRKNMSSILFCCKLLICFLIFIEFDSLSAYEKDGYKFSFVKDAIEKECVNFRKYVLKSSAFTRNRKWNFNHFINHIIFNQRKTLRNNIDTYLKYVIEDIDSYRKQSFSEQRVNIDPGVFKKISLNYLRNIGYLNCNENNEFF